MFRQEHPKPQFKREHWLNLNGQWEFAFDAGNSGEARGLALSDAVYPQSIEVPFCPESKLSGIGNTDFHASVWYRRTIEITESDLNGRVRLHFGAVDYRATIYVNEQQVGTHTGGYVSFSFDITDALKVGENRIVVHAEDDTRDRLIPSGKQSARYGSYGCYYTRTTGIWQTVWLEFMPSAHIEWAKYDTDVATATVTVRAKVVGKGAFSVEAFFDGKPMGATRVENQAEEYLTISLPLAEKHLWEVGVGGLYDLVLTYGEDRVESYFGLRSIAFDGCRFLLNGRSVFQRLILDQGFYPDGIYTAPSDEELIADIDRSMAMGFNGARLHEKVFEERFLYHADCKGYMVWGEFPNWGLDVSYADSIYGILPEWIEELNRDYNHPAIVGWCPLNETWDEKGRKQHDPVLALVYQTTKAIDPVRPCIDTSGNFHVVTDVYDDHYYSQDPKEFERYFESLAKDGTFADRFKRQTYTPGTPFFVSEYGGIGWAQDKAGWGYGNGPKTEEEFLTRLKGLTDVLLDHPRICALCYTQLTDVEQEQNGLYTYDRKPKFPPEVIHAIFARRAAIED